MLHSELAIYPGWDYLIGRTQHAAPPLLSKTLHQFVIPDSRVSKKHFRIYSVIYEQKSNYDTQSESLPPLIYCEDLESSNGTYINGELIGIIGKERVPHLLCDGDVIELTPNWIFRFQQSSHRMIFPSSRQTRDMQVRRLFSQNVAFIDLFQHFADRYAVSDRILGSGQFGNVYLSKDLSSNRQIACKIIDLDSAIRSVAEDRPNRSESGRPAHSAVYHRKKVLLEIEILSKLSHVSSIPMRRDSLLTSAAEYHQHQKGILFSPFFVCMSSR